MDKLNQLYKNIINSDYEYAEIILGCVQKDVINIKIKNLYLLELCIDEILFEKLLNNGCDPLLCNNLLITHDKNINIIKLIINIVDIEKIGNENYTALHHSVNSGNLELTKLLLSKGAKLSVNYFKIIYGFNDNHCYVNYINNCIDILILYDYDISKYIYIDIDNMSHEEKSNLLILILYLRSKEFDRELYFNNNSKFKRLLRDKYFTEPSRDLYSCIVLLSDDYLKIKCND